MTRSLLKAATRAGIAAGLAAVVWLVVSSGVEPISADDQSALPAFDPDRPVLIVARGWLWDPQSRSKTGPLELYPDLLQQRLAAVGLDAQIHEFPWSRIPSDLPSAASDFEEFAVDVSRWGAENRRCVSFAGHSAGALMVYRAAARGIPMGMMATIGLPLPAPKRPESVFGWVDVYTTSHERDLAGRLWGGSSGADESRDARSDHKDLWATSEVLELTSKGIAESWRGCRPN